MTDTRINFINASLIAEERGISVSNSLNSEPVSFSNLITTCICTKEGEIKLSGSVFGKQHYRVVNVAGYELDFRPEGNMLFLQNKDVTGVIGKVGKILSDAKINIGEYLLSRTISDGKAFSIIKVDEKINIKLIDQLIEVDEILNVKQLYI